MKQRKVLEADLTGNYTTVHALAKAVGVDPATVKKAQANSNYLLAYDAARANVQAKSLDLRKHLNSETKVAILKLKEMVELNPEMQVYAHYIKLLVDTAKTTNDLDMDMVEEEVDTAAIHSDLTILMLMAIEGQWAINDLADYYCENGAPPQKSPTYVVSTPVEIHHTNEEGKLAPGGPGTTLASGDKSGMEDK